MPTFAIELRSDDVAILDELRGCFGGTLNPAHGRGVVWRVGSKKDLAGLVAYFEQFPLRARKQADFVLWAKAVRMYVEHGYRAEGLAEIKAMLEAGREFVAAVVEQVERVTRVEVAALAGVSERAVKRAFSTDAASLSDETRARIVEAARTLGYEGKRQRPQRKLRLVS